MSMLAGIEQFIYDHLHPRLMALEARVAALEAEIRETKPAEPVAAAAPAEPVAPEVIPVEPTH